MFVVLVVFLTICVWFCGKGVLCVSKGCVTVVVVVVVCWVCFFIILFSGWNIFVECFFIPEVNECFNVNNVPKGALEELSVL